jgi:hypothetical protein
LLTNTGWVNWLCFWKLAYLGRFINWGGGGGLKLLYCW